MVLAAFWVTMALVNWRYFVFFYLPSYYLGWVLSYAEGYLEHYGGQPGNPYANSVSSYHRLYNLLWFNNGYHQEHHWDPKVHWTRMKELHQQIEPQMAANRTRILGPHITGFLEEWFNERHRRSSSQSDGRDTPATCEALRVEFEDFSDRRRPAVRGPTGRNGQAHVFR